MKLNKSTLNTIFVLSLVLSGEVLAQPWPFDQRQVLLAKSEGKDFVDDLTAAQFMDAFVRHGRIRWVTRKASIEQVLPVEVPADFPWQAASSVRQLGLGHNVDGIVQLQMQGVELNLSWYSTLDGLPLFIERLALPTASTEADRQERRNRLVSWVAAIWERIPGQGYVLSRDMQTLNIEGARQESLKEGELLNFHRIESFERHPLLQTLINVEHSPSGTGRLSRLGDESSAVEILHESTIDPIRVGDRYKVVTSGAAPSNGKQSVESLAVGASDSNKEDSLEDEPAKKRFSLFGADRDEAKSTESTEWGLLDEGAESRYLDLSATLLWGPVSHEEIAGANTFLLRSNAPGFEIEGTLFLTRNWLIEGTYRAQFLSFGTEVPPAYGVSSLSSGTRDFSAGIHYRFVFMEEAPLPAQFKLGLGYRSFSFNLGESNSDYAPSSKVYRGLDFGLFGRLPVYNNFAAFLGLNRILGANLSESPNSSGASVSAAYWAYKLGVQYLLFEPSLISAGYASYQASAQFQGQGSRARTSESVKIGGSYFFAGYTYRF